MKNGRLFKEPLVTLALLIIVLPAIGQPQAEGKILHKIERLPEVVARAEYLKVHSNGERHLQYTIYRKPIKQSRYYWVKVLEDNGEMYHTQFNFYVNATTLAIKYYDPLMDTLIDYNVWSKMKKNNR